MKLKYKLLEGGIAPTKGTPGSACWDLYMPEDVIIFPLSIVCVPLQIVFDIDWGWCIEIYPRSSTQTKLGVFSSTSIIDADYKKGIHAILYNSTTEKVSIPKGSRILQFTVKVVQNMELVQVEEIKDTGRGGLGST